MLSLLDSLCGPWVVEDCREGGQGGGELGQEDLGRGEGSMGRLGLRRG